MIITRTPLRVTFVGGGTDLKSFFAHEHGAVINAAINKYIYITVNRRFETGIEIKYSKTEVVDDIDQLEHPLFREALRYVGLNDHIEVTSHADIPGRGTGMGSSSSFLVGILHALYLYTGQFKTPSELARAAVHIEREILGEPGGLQDQYIAAFGGLRYMEFHNDDSVHVSHIFARTDVAQQLQSNLMLFYTGITRKSTEIQTAAVANAAANMDRLRTMKYHAIRLRDELHRGNHEAVGKLMHEYWLSKRQLATCVSTRDLDEAYDRAIAAGALGGKILGAGGGGFFLFYVPEEHQEAVRQALAPMEQVRFNFEREGSKVVYVADNFLPEFESFATARIAAKKAVPSDGLLPGAIVPEARPAQSRGG